MTVEAGPNTPDKASPLNWQDGKVQIFWEGHKSLWNLHLNFDWHYIGQKLDEDFAKFCKEYMNFNKYHFWVF